MDREEFLRLFREAMQGERDGIVTAATEAAIAALTESAKPQIRVSGEEMQALMGRAAAISPEAKIRVADMIADGKQVPEITGELLRIATEGGGDAGDAGGGPGSDGTGMDGQDPPPAGGPTFRKVEDVPDDAFARMINRPARYSFH